MKTIEELQQTLDRYARAAGATHPIITFSPDRESYIISARFDGAQWIVYKDRDELDADPVHVMFLAMETMILWNHAEAIEMSVSTEQD